MGFYFYFIFIFYFSGLVHRLIGVASSAGCGLIDSVVGSDLQVVGGNDGGFGWLIFFGCGGLQFVVIVVVGGVIVADHGYDNG